MPEQQVQAREPEVASPVAAAPGFSAPSFGGVGTMSHEQAILRLQQTAGNRAVVDRLGRGIQRAPAEAKQGPAAATLAPYNSYVDLFNAFGELSAAYVNDGGRGLGRVDFGEDLTPAHRSLLGDVRSVLGRSLATDADAKRQARSSWPGVARRLQTALDEAERRGLTSLAPVVDALAILNRRLGGTKAQKAATQEETSESYADAVNAIGQLMIEFTWSMKEPGPEFVREAVPGRKDIEVNPHIKESYAKTRANLSGVKVGKNVIGRHAKLVESVRGALIMARTERAGSAHAAYVRWGRVTGDLEYVLQRAERYGYDVASVRARVAEVTPMLLEHWQLVHQGNLTGALSRPRAEGELKTRQKVAKDMGPATSAALKQSIGLEDAKHAISVVENLRPSEERPGEWVLVSGPTTMRLSEEQALGLRQLVAKQLKEYIADIVRAMMDVWANYDDVKRSNSGFKLAVLSGWSGATDPGNPEWALDQMMRVRRQKVDPLIEAGKFSAAFQSILKQKALFELIAKEVGDWDRDLDVGYKRLSIAMTVVQVAISTIAPLAAAEVTASTLALTAATTTSGAGGAFAGEATRQAITGERDVGKLVDRTRHGLMIGGGGAGPAITKSVGGGIARNLGTSQAFGEYAASVGVGGGMSKAGGGSFKEGAFGGGLGWFAGKLTQFLPESMQTGVTGTAVQVGAGVGLAKLTDQDPYAAAVGALASTPGRGSGGGPKGTAPSTPRSAGATAAGDPTPAPPRGPASPKGVGGHTTEPFKPIPFERQPWKPPGPSSIPGGLRPYEPPGGGGQPRSGGQGPGTGRAPGSGRPAPVDPTGDTAQVPAAPAPVDPTGDTAHVPAAPAPVDPTGDTAQVPATPAPVDPTGDTAQVPATPAPVDPTGDTAQVPAAAAPTPGGGGGGPAAPASPLKVGGHTTEPFKPIPFERQPWKPPGPSSIPGGLRPYEPAGIGARQGAGRSAPVDPMGATGVDPAGATAAVPAVPAGSTGGSEPVRKTRLGMGSPGPAGQNAPPRPVGGASAPRVGPGGTHIGVPEAPAAAQGPGGTRVGVPEGPAGEASSRPVPDEPSPRGGAAKQPAAQSRPAEDEWLSRALKPPSGPPPGRPGYAVYAISADEAISAFKASPNKVSVNSDTRFHKYRWQTARWNDGHAISDADPPIAFRGRNGFVMVDGERWHKEGRNPADVLVQDAPEPSAGTTPAGRDVAVPSSPSGPARASVDPIGDTAEVPGANAPAPSGAGAPGTTRPGTFPARPPAAATGPLPVAPGAGTRPMAATGEVEGNGPGPVPAARTATPAPAPGAKPDEILPGGVFVKSDDFSTSVHSNADPNAYVRFEIEGKTVTMTDAYRKDLPEGSGKLLVAEGLRRVKAGPGTELVLHNVVNEPSKEAHAAGAGPREVLVGRMTLRALERLGLTPTDVRWATIRGKLCIIIKL